MEEVRLMLLGNINISPPDLGQRQKNHLKFLFSPFFVVSQKVIQISKMHWMEKVKPRKTQSKKSTSYKL